MDRDLPIEVIQKRRRRRWLTVIVIVLAFLLLIWTIRTIGMRSVEWSRIRYSIAEIGAVEATLNASGTIVPETEQAITAPAYSILQKVLLRSGDKVKSGQPILELDKESLRIELDKIQEELELQRHKKVQLSMELERKQAELQASREVKELQARFVEMQFERVKKLNDIGAVSQEELQRTGLSLEIARREVAVINLQIANQRASMETEVQALELQVHLQEKRRGETVRQLALSEAPSPLDGIVTWVKDSIGSPVRQGDVIARVADLNRYRLQGEISAVNAGLVAVGQKVHVRTGEAVIGGVISSVSPLVRNGVISFDVQLDDPADKILRPNLRADVYVVTSSADGVLRVSNGPFYEGHYDQTVFVVRGDRAEARKADIGAANFDWVEIRGDISPGDTVIVSDMRKYNRAGKLSIKNKT